MCQLLYVMTGVCVSLLRSQMCLLHNMCFVSKQKDVCVKWVMVDETNLYLKRISGLCSALFKWQQILGWTEWELLLSRSATQTHPDSHISSHKLWSEGDYKGHTPD